MNLPNTIQKKRPGGTMGMKLIRWKPNEIKMIALNWIAICRNKHIDPISHYNMTDTLVEAQQVLTADRHRKKSTLTGKSNKVAIIKQVALFLEAEKTNKAKIELATSTTQPDSLPSTHTSSTQSILSDSQTNNTSQELSVEYMILQFADSIASIVVGETIKSLKQAFMRELPKLTLRAQQVSKALPKILIVGPLPKQHPQLEEAVSGVADLKFVSSEESPRLIQLRGASCIACLLWTDFVKHSHQDAVKKLFNSNNMRYVSGTLNELQSELENFAVIMQDSEII